MTSTPPKRCVGVEKKPKAREPRCRVNTERREEREGGGGGRRGDGQGMGGEGRGGGRGGARTLRTMAAKLGLFGCVTEDTSVFVRVTGTLSWG